MAWTEVCKVNFIQAVKHLTVVKGMSLRKALTKLSEESGIAFRTLEDWFYKDVKDSTTKNRGIEEGVENTEEKGVTGGDKEWTCRACGRSDVAPAVSAKGKELTPKSIHYGLCGGCRRKSQRAISNSNEDCLTVACKCGEIIKIPWATVRSRLKKYEEGLKNGETV
jgi:hypothetical protein